MIRISNISGLIWPPLVWAVVTQLGQIMPYGDCAQGRSGLSLVAIAALLLTLIATVLSLIRAPQLQGTSRSLAIVSGCVGIAFVFAIVMQMAATLTIDPCAR